VIGDKTSLEVWSGKAAQDHGLLRVFESPAYFSAKDGKVNPRAKKFVFLSVKRNMKGYRLWNPENKKIVLSQHVTFDETSVLKSTISQQVERLKTNDVSQRVEVDATPPSPVVDPLIICYVCGPHTHIIRVQFTCQRVINPLIVCVYDSHT